jgi:nitrite reductase/ring-hydroxylating ferredoxin subunit
VLWADAAGQWRCFEDRCPHRLATLSDGLVDKQRGEIVCAYHGWRFQVRPAAATRGLPGWLSLHCGAAAVISSSCQS